MIRHEPLPVKHISLMILFVCSSLITAYVLFVALVSVWVGVQHLHQVGFWMPILAGILTIIVILGLFLRLFRFILDQSKEKDAFHV